MNECEGKTTRNKMLLQGRERKMRTSSCVGLGQEDPVMVEGRGDAGS